jgi:AraC-like DNA-binding protein
MLRLDSKRVLSVPVARNGGMIASLTHYREGSQGLHTHGEDQLSYLLFGEVREHVAGREHDLLAASRSFKPAGLSHSNSWGRGGALMFSLSASPGKIERLADIEPGWGKLECPRLLGRLIRACLTASNEEERGDSATEIAALACGGIARRFNDPPPWLDAVRSELRESGGEARIGAIADRAGIHRAYLSRAFVSYFGIDPSSYRLRCLAACAISDAVTGMRSLTQITLDRGFYDQSHGARVIRKGSGLSLGELRALLQRRGNQTAFTAGADGGAGAAVRR